MGSLWRCDHVRGRRGCGLAPSRRHPPADARLDAASRSCWSDSLPRRLSAWECSRDKVPGLRTGDAGLNGRSSKTGIGFSHDAWVGISLLCSRPTGLLGLLRHLLADRAVASFATASPPRLASPYCRRQGALSRSGGRESYGRRLTTRRRRLTVPLAKPADTMKGGIGRINTLRPPSASSRSAPGWPRSVTTTRATRCADRGGSTPTA